MRSAPSAKYLLSQGVERPRQIKHEGPGNDYTFDFDDPEGPPAVLQRHGPHRLGRKEPGPRESGSASRSTTSLSHFSTVLEAAAGRYKKAGRRNPQLELRGSFTGTNAAEPYSASRKGARKAWRLRRSTDPGFS